MRDRGGKESKSEEKRVKKEGIRPVEIEKSYPEAFSCRLEASGLYDKPIVTEILPADIFYTAEVHGGEGPQGFRRVDSKGEEKGTRGMGFACGMGEQRVGGKGVETRRRDRRKRQESSREVGISGVPSFLIFTLGEGGCS